MLISVVVPVYNEVDVLPILITALEQEFSALGCDYELLFVDDASRDGSGNLITAHAKRNRHIRMLTLSRNFGHQIAITAGLDFASGDAVIIMDADMQDPPALIPQLVHWYKEGFHVVSAQRSDRASDSIFKRNTAKLFYRAMRALIDRRLQPDVGDFRLLSRTAVLALRSCREQHRFLRGLIAWLGFNEVLVPFERPARGAGTSKYPLSKMMAFAWTAIFSSSALPLRLSLGFGLGLTGLGIVYLAYAVYMAVITKSTVHGWTSLVVIQIIFSGAILVAIGLLGEYIGKIFDESKRRPLYILQNPTDPDRFRPAE